MVQGHQNPDGTYLKPRSIDEIGFPDDGVLPYFPNDVQQASYWNVLIEALNALRLCGSITVTIPSGAQNPEGSYPAVTPLAVVSFPDNPLPYFPNHIQQATRWNFLVDAVNALRLCYTSGSSTAQGENNLDGTYRKPVSVSRVGFPDADLPYFDNDVQFATRWNYIIDALNSLRKCCAIGGSILLETGDVGFFSLGDILRVNMAGDILKTYIWDTEPFSSEGLFGFTASVAKNKLWLYPEYDDGEAPLNQEFRIDGTPTTGTFTITFRGDTTAAIPFNATVNEVVAALKLLPSIGLTGVRTSLAQGNWAAVLPDSQYIQFFGPLGQQEVEPFTITDSTDGGLTVTETTKGGLSNAAFNVQGNPSSGTFTVTFRGDTTAPISFNATTADVVAALELLPSIGAGNVRPNALYPSSNVLPLSLEIEFCGVLGHQAVELPTITDSTDGGLFIATQGGGGYANGLYEVFALITLDLTTGETLSTNLNFYDFDGLDWDVSGAMVNPEFSPWPGNNRTVPNAVYTFAACSETCDVFFYDENGVLISTYESGLDPHDFTIQSLCATRAGTVWAVITPTGVGNSTLVELNPANGSVIQSVSWSSPLLVDSATLRQVVEVSPNKLIVQREDEIWLLDFDADTVVELIGAEKGTPDFDINEAGTHLILAADYDLWLYEIETDTATLIKTFDSKIAWPKWI